MDIVLSTSLVCAVFTLLLTYSIGHILISFIRIPQQLVFLRELAKLCSGIFAVSTVYAVIRTQGFTALLLILLLFVFFIAWLKHTGRLNSLKESFNKINSLNSLPFVLIQLGVLLISVVLLYLKIKDPFSATTFEVYGDFYNYAKIAEHLNKTGVEGCYIDWYTGITPARNLYHFGELWYAAFFSRIFQQTPFYTFYFQLFPVMMVVYVFGGFALIESFFKPQNKLIYALALLLLFSCGISFYIPKDTLFTRGDWNDLSLMYQPKYFYTAVFILFSLLFIRYKKYIPVVLIGLATIVFSAVTAPSILMTLAVWLILLFVLNEITFKELIRYSIPVPVFLVFFGFYVLLMQHINERHALVDAVSSVASAAPVEFTAYLKTAFNCFAGQIIKSTLSLFSFIILFLSALLRKENQITEFNRIILFLLILHVFSVLSYAVFHIIGVDAVQLWSMQYIPLSAIVCFMIAVNGMMSKSILLRILTAVLVILSFIQSKPYERYRSMDMNYVKQVKRLYDGSMAVFFKSGDDYTSLYSKNISMYAPTQYLIMDYKNYHPVCLNVYDIPKSAIPYHRKMEEEFIRNSVFNTYVVLQKKNNTFVSVTQSQQDFIRDFKIRYVFTYKNAVLPDFIKPGVLHVVRETNYGITLYVLK
jgi:hypothetical protein